MDETRGIDPAWEYWTPEDPEIDEILQEAAQLSEFEGLGIEMRRVKKHGGNLGLRFGSGNPDAFGGWLKKEKPPSTRPTVARRNCATCGRPWTPEKRNIRYCSAECRKTSQRGAHRILPDRVCPVCDTVFRPKARAQRFCTLTCSNRGKPRREPKADFERLETLYGAGVAMALICSELGITRNYANKILRRRGVTMRPAGRPKNQVIA